MIEFLFVLGLACAGIFVGIQMIWSLYEDGQAARDEARQRSVEQDAAVERRRLADARFKRFVERSVVKDGSARHHR
jgi:hypothetical protein